MRLYCEKKLKWGFTADKEKHNQKWNLKLRELVCTGDVERLIVLNGSWIDYQVLEAAREHGVHLTLWLIDSIRRMPENEKKLELYHDVYSFEPADIPYLREKYRISVRYLSGGFDPRIYHVQSTEKDIDISFIGSSTRKRNQILKKVAEYAKENGLTFQVYGRYWDERYFWKRMRFFRRYAPLGEYVKNSNIPACEVAEVYRRSRICLNIHIETHDGPNSRIFEILGTKGFQLVDDKATLEQVIQRGEEVETYKNAEDLVEKIAYYLKNPVMAARVVEAGYLRVVKEHDLRKKAAMLLQETEVEA